MTQAQLFESLARALRRVLPPEEVRLLLDQVDELKPYDTEAELLADVVEDSTIAYALDTERFMFRRGGFWESTPAPPTTDDVLAALAASTSAVDFNGQRLTNIGPPLLLEDAATKTYVDGLTGFEGVAEALAAADEPVSFNGQELIDLADPTTPQSAATASYVDTAIASALDPETPADGTKNIVGNLSVRASGGAAGSEQFGEGASAAAANATAVGEGAQAQTAESLAIGSGTLQDTIASGAGAHAIGAGALASNTNATAIGPFATASGNASISIGPGTTVSGTDGIGIRSQTNSALRGVAIGRSTIVTGAEGGTAVGYGAEATGATTPATAYGRLANASATAAVALGYDAQASATDGIAIGHSAKAKTNPDNIAIGRQAQSSDGVVIGSGVDATAGAGHVTIGNGVTVTAATRAVTIGRNAVVNGTDVVVVGDSATGTASQTTAVGQTADATAENATALGYGAQATASQATSIGANANAGSTLTTVVGYGAGCGTSGGTAVGYSAAASGDSVALGRSASALGNASVGVGKSVVIGASHADAIAIGNGATTTAANDGQWGSSAHPASLRAYGGLSLPIATKSANYALTALDHTILVDASGAARTITLPPAASYPGWTFNVKKVDATANAVTLDADGAETIDGALTQSTTTQWFSWQVQSDGAAWYVL